MAKQRTKRQKAIIKRRIFISCALAVIAVAVALIVMLVNLIAGAFKEKPNNKNDGSSITSSAEAESKEPKKVSSATVVNIGDIMVHDTQFKGAKVDGGYDFSAFFKNMGGFFKDADLTVGNLEVTFGGSESGAFSGYPAFNTPDNLAEVMKKAGIDVALTANNHCYDTGLFGLTRTLDTLKNVGISYNGTRKTPTDKPYLIKEVNGIKIGIINYTYENSQPKPDKKSINGAIIKAEANDLINSFSYDRINLFYTDAENQIKAMENGGADCIVFYMHWGEEYQLKQNTWQSSIAQKLCNMGVDVIVGGHPHVVQPIELIHSEDSQNTTVCIYSLGNAVSNQRQELMAPECTTGHTEDGMMFYYTFDKYSDGTTVLSGVDIIPTWVNKYRGGSGYQYTIVPLENADDGINKYGLTGDAASRSQKSYSRTKAIVENGLREVQTHLGCKVRFEADTSEEQ